MPEGDDDEELDDEELARRLQSQEMGMAHGHMQGLAGLGEYRYRLSDTYRHGVQVLAGLHANLRLGRTG
jgi:hypothetical protein